MTFKPMKPPSGKLEDVDLKIVRFPTLGLAKLDGMRISVQDGKVMSNSLKLVPNKQLQKMFGRPEFEGLDGEFIAGDPVAADVFNVSCGMAMAENAEVKNSVWFVFDKFDSKAPYSERYEMARKQIMAAGTLSSFIQLLPYVELNSLTDLQEYENRCIELGFEGMILRAPKGTYKQGRSTLTEQGMLRRKPFEDGEALIVGCEEEMENRNPAFRDEMGRMKRSSHQENKVGKDSLGKYNCVGLTVFKDVKFNVSGFGTMAFQKQEWEKFKSGADSPVGKILKFKFQRIGSIDKPRIPIAIGYRPAIDTEV